MVELFEGVNRVIFGENILVGMGSPGKIFARARGRGWGGYASVPVISGFIMD